MPHSILPRHAPLALGALALLLGGLSPLACAEGTEVLGKGDGEGGGGAGGAGGGGAGGAGGTCAPGFVEVCYSGAPATQNVGVCHGGTHVCDADGAGFGPCEGEALPGTEDCTTPVDDDCDGSTTDVEDGCSCAPGSTKACYEGPAGTEGVGACKGGVATCLADGSGFGPCAGSVVPGLENCDTPADDDCDGVANEADAGCGVVDCDAACVPSPVAGCAGDVVVVGHYQGGNRTVCVSQGDGTPFSLALMSYETTNWSIGGATARVTALQVYSVDALGTITGNGGIPTQTQQGGAVPADPYDYAQSMGECAAHTGYAGAVFGETQGNVCHMETGLASECSYPAYTCLSISP